MMKNVNREKMITNIDYLEAYPVNEAAKLFTCLSLELQDELLAIMRKMVAENKAI